GVADERGREQRIAEIGARQMLALSYRYAEPLDGVLALERARDRAGEHGFGQRRHGDAERERRLDRPAASALLPGAVGDHLEQWFSGRAIAAAENIGR